MRKSVGGVYVYFLEEIRVWKTKGDLMEKDFVIFMTYYPPSVKHIYPFVIIAVINLHFLWKLASLIFRCGITAGHSLGILQTFSARL